MGFVGVKNRKAIEWVENFTDKPFSPTGETICIRDVQERRDDTIESLYVRYSVNDELQISNQKYRGFLRAMRVYEDPESLDQVLMVDLIVALDKIFPRDFYTGLDEYIRDNYLPFLTQKFPFSKLILNSYKISFEGSYINSSSFFEVQAEYTNKLIFRYDVFDDLFRNPPATEFDEQNEKFCQDILRIGDCLREQFVDAFKSYLIDKENYYKKVLSDIKNFSI